MSFIGRSKSVRKEPGMLWGVGEGSEAAGQRSFYPEVNLIFRRGVKGGGEERVLPQVRVSQYSGAWGNKRIFTKVWLTSILFRFTMDSSTNPL